MSLKIVTLLDPTMCKECRFAGSIIVTQNNRTEVMFKCKRLDCDNHVHESSVPLTGETEDLD